MSSLSLSSILTHANLTMYQNGSSLESSQQHLAASTTLPSIDTLTHMPSLSYSSNMMAGQWYKQINPQCWSERNVLDWLSDHIESTKFDATTLSLAYCAMDGPTLCQMSYDQMLTIFGPQLGSHLHQSLQELRIKYELQSLSGVDLNDEACQLLDHFLENLDVPLNSLSVNFPRLSTVKVHEVVTNIKKEFDYDETDLSQLAVTPLDMDYTSDSEYSSSSTGGVFSFHNPSSPESRSSSDSDPEFSYPQIAKEHIKTEKGDLRTKRPRGRPPKLDRHHGINYFSHPKKTKHAQRGTHLWEFIRDILIHPEKNQGLMKWEDRRDGVFKFLKSEAVAQMWGQKKKNSSMTYEKLSRAMRYYYKREILERVDGRRLVYKFGKNSSGWKAEETGMAM